MQRQGYDGLKGLEGDSVMVQKRKDHIHQRVSERGFVIVFKKVNELPSDSRIKTCRPCLIEMELCFKAVPAKKAVPIEHRPGAF
jgi:hypothetical protein